MRRRFTKKVALPLFETLTGRRFWSELARQRELQWRTVAELEAQRLAKIRKLVADAGAHVPFYRDLYRETGVDPEALHSLDDLRQLPIVTKRALRDQPRHEVTAANLPQRRLISSATSGSTGMPFAFWMDRAASDRHLGSFLLGLEWVGVSLWDLRIDVVVTPGVSWSSRLTSSSRWATTLRGWLLGQKVRRIGHLEISAEELCEQVESAARGRDYYLRVYPSQAGQLAREMLDLGLELEHAPKAVISSTETLTAVNAKALGEAFPCPVVNHYSCWEALHLAQSCPDHPDRLHVNSAIAHLRVVREDGSEADRGETGRILLTSLTNEVMPFINYELGDRGALGGTCPCGRGSQTLLTLDGRTDEVITGQDGGFLSPIVLNQLSALGKAERYLQEFQLVETTERELLVRVVPTSRFDDRWAEMIRKELLQILGSAWRITVETVADIPREASGKRLVIKPLAGSRGPHV